MMQGPELRRRIHSSHASRSIEEASKVMSSTPAATADRHDSSFLRAIASPRTRRGALLLCVLPLALAGCGESSSEKAAKNVCSATKEINAQLQKLQSLPISTSFPSEAKTSVEAITSSIKKIDESAPNLESARKTEIDAANKAFQQEIALITKDVISASSSSNLSAGLKSAEPQIKASLNKLATNYKKAYEELKCSS
jgi:hypothetical protein